MEPIRFVAPLALLLVSVGAAADPAPQFTDVTAASGLKVNQKKRPNQPEYGLQTPHGVAIEDFDGDGLLDILIVCFGEPDVQLFRNLGNLRFADVTKGSGLETFKGWGTGAAVTESWTFILRPSNSNAKIMA